MRYAGRGARSRREAEALIAVMRPQLLVDERTREVARFVLNQRPPSLAVAPAQAAIFAAAVASGSPS